MKSGSIPANATVDYVYLHGDGVLVIGWCHEADIPAEAITIIVGVEGTEKQHKLTNAVRYDRPDVTKELGLAQQAKTGFVAAFALPSLEITEQTVIGVGLYCLVEEDSPDALFTEDVELTVELMTPNATEVDNMLRQNWLVWKDLIKVASTSAEMKQAFETLNNAFEDAPELEILPAAPWIKIHVDAATTVDQSSIFLSGWLLNTDPSRGPITDMIVTLTNKRTKLRYSTSILEQLNWINRPDVLEHFGISGSKNVGFNCFVDLDIDAFNPHDYYAAQVVATTAGFEMSFEFELVDLQGQPIELSRRLFTLFPLNTSNIKQLYDKHFGPALSRSWAAFRELGHLDIEHRDADVRQFGKYVENPKATLIVPLYGRYDFVEYQLSQLVLDPEMRDVEILYVNDDPAIQDQLVQLCQNLEPIYRLSYRLVFGHKNFGYAGANNLGVLHANADAIVLINSDVMPAYPGWLGQLLELHQSTPDAGVISARLLYEDGSIQHDGVSYERYAPYQDMWLCTHPGKGLSQQLRPAKDGLNEVTAATGACMMIAKKLYQEVGGLDADYIIGDFEDSDLCLKLLQKGYKNYIASSINLYHLERQSQGGAADWKAKLTLFNCWQHHERWNDVIEKQMASSASK